MFCAMNEFEFEKKEKEITVELRDKTQLKCNGLFYSFEIEWNICHKWTITI